MSPLSLPCVVADVAVSVAAVGVSVAMWSLLLLLLLLLLSVVPAALHCSAALVVAPAAAALRVAAAVTVCTLRHAQSVHGMDQSWYGQGYGHACCALLLGDQDGFLALRSHCHHRDERAQRCR